MAIMSRVGAPEKAVKPYNIITRFDTIRRSFDKYIRSHQSSQAMSERTAKIERNTKETQIRAKINIDGNGVSSVDIGVPFMEHMLDQVARHGMMDIEIVANGDLEIDAHHTVEDVGICLGQAVREALGDKAGIRRYGHFTLPMEEVLATTAIDLGGRAMSLFSFFTFLASCMLFFLWILMFLNFK